MNNTTSSSTRSSTRTVALRAQDVVVWYIGKGESVRIAAVATIKRGVGILGDEVTQDRVHSASYARKHYKWMLERSTRLQLGFKLDDNGFTTEGVEYYLAGVRSTSVKNAEFEAFFFPNL